jgi:hypothetical protein
VRAAPNVQEERISYLLSRISGGISEEEYAGVLHELRETTNDLCDHVFNEKRQAPPLFELYWRERATFYSDKSWVEERARTALAMQRDITDLLHAQVEQRRLYGGNVVLEFSGPTGMGKSSAMLHFAETHNGLRDHIRRGGVEALRDRIGIDIADLPRKLDKLSPGDACMLDEQLALVGENSTTHLALLRNCEETLRGTMIDLHFASPTTRDHATSQGVLTAISNSPAQMVDGRKGEMSTTFLYRIAVDGEVLPLGTVTIPWCSAETYAAYKVIKDESLARTKKLQFHATGTANERVLRVMFEDTRFRTLLRYKAQPKKKDWSRYVRQYAHSMSIAEVEATASQLEEMVMVLKRSPRDFRTIWGFEAPSAMKHAISAGAEDSSDDDTPTSEVPP